MLEASCTQLQLLQSPCLILQHLCSSYLRNQLELCITLSITDVGVLKQAQRANT